jgi:hypothetical protein
MRSLTRIGAPGVKESPRDFRRRRRAEAKKPYTYRVFCCSCGMEYRVIDGTAVGLCRLCAAKEVPC